MIADDNDTPDMGELLTAVAELAARRSLGGWLPGRVESYDSATCRANVQVLILEPNETEAGGREMKRRPVIVDVPVGFAGAGGMRVKFPISKGDTVVLLFCARSTDRFKASGKEVDPDDDRHHDLSDAIALPFDLSIPKSKNAGAFIEFTSSNLIKCGGDEPLVTRAEFNAHTHFVETTGTAAAQVGAALAVAVVGTPPAGSGNVTGTAKLRG